MSPSGVRTMRELLAILPQELYDQIFRELGFRKVVEVNKQYLPPVLLRINRSTRTKFAKSYYANTILVIEQRFGRKFLRSLTAEQVGLLADVRAVISLEQVPAKWYDTAGLRRLARQILGLKEDGEMWQALKKRGVVKLSILEVEIF